MVKEYINELLLENNEELLRQEKQMKELLDSLDSARHWLEILQAEKNADRNIFSPRAMDTDIREKIEEAQNNIKKIDQDIEYVRSFIETHIKKREEYERLLQELDTFSDNSVPQNAEKKDPVNDTLQNEEQKPEQDSAGQDSQQNPGQDPDHNQKQGSKWNPDQNFKQDSEYGSEKNPEEVSKQDPEKSDEEQKTGVQNDQNLQNGQKTLELTIDFLSEIYRKTEICLALLNGDKNKCRNELKSLKNMIRNAVDDLKKKEM